MMKVAIIHYWLVGMRGGEKVIEALIDLFPDADIYTHVLDREKISEKILEKKIYTSKIQGLPCAKKMYQKYMPLMPASLLTFDLQKYDLVISSESGPAKGVIPNPEAFHICYCHTPMRYLWDMYHQYYNESGILTKLFMKLMVPKLRVWDVQSSNLVDHFIPNSNFTKKRVERYYNRDATVVYPPVDIDQYLDIKRKPKDYYLFFGQLVGYKRADIAIEACITSGKDLVIIGDGKLKNHYPENIHILGRQSDDEVKKHFAHAKALLFPGIEDFGMIPVEANAAGCPVIAYDEGGARDTVKHGSTGLLFKEQTPESLVKAMKDMETNYEDFTQRDTYYNHVKQFSIDVFKENIQQIVKERKRV